MEFCWAQWVQMGLFGSPRRRDSWSIDPESVIFFTRAVARDDPRLAEAAAEWIGRNGKLLTRRRLDYLGKRLEAIKALPEELPGPRSERRRGFGRRATSTEPDLKLSVNLTFRLRHLLGNGSRAEIVRVLIGLPYPYKPSVRQIAELVAYSKRNTQEALNSLASADVIQREKRGVRMEAYYLDRRRWADFLRIEIESLPATVFWPQVLRVTLSADRYLLRMEELGAESTYLAASLAGDFLSENTEDLSAIGLLQPGGVTVDDFPLLFTHHLEELRSIFQGMPSGPGLGGALYT